MPHICHEYEVQFQFDLSRVSHPSCTCDRNEAHELFKLVCFWSCRQKHSQKVFRFVMVSEEFPHAWTLCISLMTLHLQELLLLLLCSAILFWAARNLFLSRRRFLSRHRAPCAVVVLCLCWQCFGLPRRQLHCSKHSTMQCVETVFHVLLRKAFHARFWSIQRLLLWEVSWKRRRRDLNRWTFFWMLGDQPMSPACVLSVLDHPEQWESQQLSPVDQLHLCAFSPVHQSVHIFADHGQPEVHFRQSEENVQFGFKIC